MAAVEKLEMEGVGRRAGGDDCVAERDRSQVEPVLVSAACVDPDRTEPGERAGVPGSHADGVPGKPTGEDVRANDPGVEAERQLDGAVRRRGEGGRGRVDVLEQRIGVVLEDGPSGAEIGPERLERAVVEVAEGLRGRGELGAERDVEERVAGVGGEARRTGRVAASTRPSIRNRPTRSRRARGAGLPGAS